MINNDLKITIENLNVEIISDERKQILQPLIEFIQTKVSTNQAGLGTNFSQLF
jgi:hypothetical protein